VEQEIGPLRLGGNEVRYLSNITQRPALHALAIWFILSSTLIGSHWQFYFRETHIEDGDFAANALQIRKAKTFGEIYGNYSRWRFHHPGPGFFYCYAAGEALLYDGLKAVPSPHNAHLFTGVLLQSLFFYLGCSNRCSTDQKTPAGAATINSRGNPLRPCQFGDPDQRI
jgi:hypothetical protein